jgi:hypothetical protein
MQWESAFEAQPILLITCFMQVIQKRRVGGAEES